MARIDAGRAAQVGGFVFRYLWARHRCMGADAPPTPRRLTILVAQGEREFNGIDVEPDKDQPIRRDINHPDFFRAIVLLEADGFYKKGSGGSGGETGGSSDGNKPRSELTGSPEAQTPPRHSDRNIEI
jgi:hypothetical protein